MDNLSDSKHSSYTNGFKDIQTEHVEGSYRLIVVKYVKKIKHEKRTVHTSEVIDK